MAQKHTTATADTESGFKTLVFSDREHCAKSLDKTIKSFDETLIQAKIIDNPDPNSRVSEERKDKDCLGSNLQYLRSSQMLSVSLKTLPEDDFSSNTDCSHQVRGSNQSLSMNVEENASTCSSKQNQFIRTKKNLLQRRNSNTSLALNIQHSNSGSLNRFNSHNSLNCLHQMNTDRNARKGLLDLNYSMCSLSTNGINTKPNNPIHTEPSHCSDYQYRRKFLSSENLHNLFNNTSSSNPKFQNCKFKCDVSGDRTERPPIFDFSRNFIEMDDDLDDSDQYNSDNTRNRITIKTKPLSPQSTSEDYKIYLANQHFLENASNPLSAENLTNLSCAFHTNTSNPKIPSKNSSGLFANSHETTSLDASCNPIKATVTSESDVKKGSIKKLDNFFNYKLKSTPPFETLNPNDQDKKKCLVKLHQEFWEIPTNYQDKPMVFGQNHKNRYKSILPNESTRVILTPDSATEPYINANFIKGPDYKTNCYIATQGPMPNTIYEFWLMICQENQRKTNLSNESNYSKIAMLTNFVENQCSVYFPIDKNQIIAFTNSTNKLDNEVVVQHSTAIYDEMNNNKNNNSTNKSEGTSVSSSIFAPNYNYFLIKNIDVSHQNGYSIRKLNIVYRICGGSESNQTDNFDKKYEFYVIHYWFFDWPDHRSPENVDFLLDMSLDLFDDDPNSHFSNPMTMPKPIATIGDQKTTCKSYLQENVETYNINSIKLNQNPTQLETPTLRYEKLLSSDFLQAFANRPLLTIHCSAGIGRTGCLAAILNGLGQMFFKYSKVKCKHNELSDNDNPNITVDILRIVCHLRLNRGGMVQNSEQYELIHRTLCLFQERLTHLV